MKKNGEVRFLWVKVVDLLEEMVAVLGLEKKWEQCGDGGGR